MSKIDNIEAFPTPLQYDQHGLRVVNPCPGMTLLDYFAGKVLEGELAGQDSERGYYDLTNPERLSKFTDLCYKVAVQMLKSRDTALRLIEES